MVSQTRVLTLLFRPLVCHIPSHLRRWQSQPVPDLSPTLPCTGRAARRALLGLAYALRMLPNDASPLSQLLSHNLCLRAGSLVGHVVGYHCYTSGCRGYTSHCS